MEVVDVRILFFLIQFLIGQMSDEDFSGHHLSKSTTICTNQECFLIFLWFFTRRKKGKKIFIRDSLVGRLMQIFWGCTFAFYSPRLFAADVLDWDSTAILWCWDGRSVCCPDRITRTVTRKHRHTFNLCWLAGRMADLFLPFKSFFFFFFKVLMFCSVGPELLQFEIAFGFWFDFLLFSRPAFFF